MDTFYQMQFSKEEDHLLFGGEIGNRPIGRWTFGPPKTEDPFSPSCIFAGTEGKASRKAISWLKLQDSAIKCQVYFSMGEDLLLFDSKSGGPPFGPREETGQLSFDHPKTEDPFPPLVYFCGYGR